MKIHIEFDTNNAVFADDFNDSCRLILQKLAFKDWGWKQDYPILDVNGNTIGKTWSEKEKEAHQVS